MSYILVFHPEVESELHAAYRWYEQQSYGLGDDFLAANEDVFNRLMETPEVQQMIHRDARRALPPKFPYGVNYRVHADRVEVIAVHHTRRIPADRQSRV